MNDTQLYVTQAINNYLPFDDVDTLLEHYIQLTANHTVKEPTVPLQKQEIAIKLKSVQMHNNLVHESETTFQMATFPRRNNFTKRSLVS
ncbi:MAG: hypothetical protein AAGF26_19755, partial [Cyanobacteria bacterium P01_G01_bin.49]